jgi:flagellar biosynthetic protein FlhB
MADDYADKTETPTPKRRADARRDGQIARSADLSAAFVLIVVLAMAQMTGGKLISAMKSLLASALSLQPIRMNDLLAVGVAILPLLVAVVAAVLLINLLQVGFFFRLRIRFDAIDPAMGVERIFSRKSLARLAIDALKLTPVAWLAYSTIRNAAARVVAVQQLEPGAAWSAGIAIVGSILWRIALLLLFLGVVDYAYQRWQHERDLRMSRREVRDELRQMESRARRNVNPFAAIANQKGGA